MTWKLEKTQFDPKDLQLEESLFALGNGYLGVRGNFEELNDELRDIFNIKSIRGTYINAFYDDVDIEYAEKAFGFPEKSQKMLNLIDAQTIQIYLGDELFSLYSGKILDYSRVLHFKEGFSERIIHYQSPLGKEVIVTFKRLVSFEYKELFMQEVTIEPINYHGPVKVISILNGDVENYVDKSDPRVSSGHAKRLSIQSHQEIADFVMIESTTKESDLSVLVLSHTSMTGDYEKNTAWKDTAYVTTFTCNLKNTVTLSKYNLYYDSLRYTNNRLNLALLQLENLLSLPFLSFIQSQQAVLDAYYAACDIVIQGNSSLQQGMRFNLFHLFQSVGKDAISNISAKGLSGEGYEGHYFWDTEIYVFPVFLLTNPKLAKNLLLYRYHTLDYARIHAKEMGHSKGALFPWRTIKGSECSSYFPAGSAQYHINADISYSYVQYYLVTEDFDFMCDYGAEILFETARIYSDMGHFNQGSFHIHAVTGPDEYTAIVNNNYYTNVMAKYNLNWAYKIYELMKLKVPQKLIELMAKLQITETEITIFKEAADKMYLPFDENKQINPQDDSFLTKPIWDFENTPKSKYPLLLHYHPLAIYRHQVCKQADTVLAHFLLEDEVDLNTISNSYHYYENVTTHDSSLSSCIFSIMAMRIDEIEKGYAYFIETARMDLDNTHKNSKDGLHMANMGGTYMAIVYGFGGLRIKEGHIAITPKIPKQIEQYTFPVHYRDRVLCVTVSHEHTYVELIKGDSLKIEINQCLVELKLNETYRVWGCV